MNRHTGDGRASSKNPLKQKRVDLRRLTGSLIRSMTPSTMMLTGTRASNERDLTKRQIMQAMSDITRIRGQLRDKLRKYQVLVTIYIRCSIMTKFFLFKGCKCWSSRC